MTLEIYRILYTNKTQQGPRKIRSMASHSRYRKVGPVDPDTERGEPMFGYVCLVKFGV